MAHVKLHRDDAGRARLSLNGMDLTNEVIADGLRVVSTGTGEHDEMAVVLTVALSRLDIGEHHDVDAALLVGSSLIRMATPAPFRGDDLVAE